MRRSRETRRTSDWACDEALETAARYVSAVRRATGVSGVRALFSRPPWASNLLPTLAATGAAALTAVALWRGPPIFRKFCAFAGLLFAASLAFPLVKLESRNGLAWPR